MTRRRGCGRCGRSQPEDTVPLVCTRCLSASHRECYGLPRHAFFAGVWTCPSCMLAARGPQAALDPDTRRDVNRFYMLIQSATTAEVASQHYSRLTAFAAFCTQRLGLTHGQAIPADPTQGLDKQAMVLFLAHKSRTVCQSTLDHYASTFNVFHTDRGLPPPAADRLFQLVVAGAGRAPSVTGRGAREALAPTTLALLCEELLALHAAAPTLARQARYLRDLVLLQLGFFCLLRRSELHRLTWEDVAWSIGHVHVRLIKDKTNHTGMPRTVCIPAQPMPGFDLRRDLDALLRAATALGASTTDPLLAAFKPRKRAPDVYDVHKAMTIDTPSLVLRERLDDLKRRSGADFDVSVYASHSLRRGGATALHAMGVPVATIMQMGRWASLAVMGYLQPQPWMLAANWHSQAAGRSPWPLQIT